MELEPTSSGSNRLKHPDLWTEQLQDFQLPLLQKIAIVGLSDDSL